MPTPDALLFLSSHCQHCPAVLNSLAELVKQGVIGRLEVVNLEARPEAAEALGIRTVPWVRIGPFELHGLRGREELAEWAGRADRPEGMADYFHVLLKEGQLQRVIGAVRQEPARLAALLPIVANPEASLNVRIGAGAVLETFAADDALRALVPALGELSAAEDARVRADACHYLALSASPAATPYLRERLNDTHPEVAEIAAEGLARLSPA